MQQMLSISPESKEYTAEKDSFNENAIQTYDRVTQTLDGVIVYLENSKEHDDKIEEFKNMKTTFITVFDVWKSAVEEEMVAYEEQSGFVELPGQTYFDNARNAIDVPNKDAISKVLNTDRDYYQAFVTLQNMLRRDPRLDSFTSENNSYEENAQQALTRTEEGAVLMLDYLRLYDAENPSIKTLEDQLDVFKDNFELWKTDVDSYVNAYVEGNGFLKVAAQDEFNTARGIID